MKKSNIYYGIVPIPIILILFTSSILFYFNEKTVNEISSEYFQYIEEDFINDNKQILVEKIKNITQKIDYESQKVEENLRDDLKEKMIMAINIAKNTYEKNKNSLEHDQLRQLVVDNISNLTFYEGRGYFYILDVNDFTILGHPTKKFIGKDFSKFKDATGQKPIHIQKKLLLEKNATIVYLKLYFYRPNEDKQMYPKLVSSTIFKPLNLFFGTGEYLDIVENKTKQRIISEIKNLNKLNLGNKVNLVKVDDLNLNSYESIILNESKLNPLNILKNKKLKEQLISKLKKDSKAFITYKDENNVVKYAYFYYDAKWNWLLSSEFSLEDLKKSFDDLNNITQIKLDKLKDSDTISTIFMVFVLLLISLYIFSKYKTLISNYTRTIENKNTLLAKHKIELEDKVKKAIEENREKELKLFEQSKMADMARMMSNIAHQWRQPLRDRKSVV